jgi:hypothetical protein
MRLDDGLHGSSIMAVVDKHDLRLPPNCARLAAADMARDFPSKFDKLGLINHAVP